MSIIGNTKKSWEISKCIDKIINDTGLSAQEKISLLGSLGEEAQQHTVEAAAYVGVKLFVGALGYNVLEAFKGENPVTDSLSVVKDCVEAVGIAGVALSAVSTIRAKYKAWQLRKEQETIDRYRQIAKERGVLP